MINVNDLMLKPPASHRVLKARSDLMRDPRFQFYGSVSWYLKWEESKSVPTAGASLDRYVYNPDFVDSLSDDELQGLICHEVEHICRRHLKRFSHDDKRINHEKANYVCDGVINTSLRNIGVKLPKNGVVQDPKYRNKCEEEIYNLMPDSEVPEGYEGDLLAGSGDGEGEGGEGVEATGTPATVKEQELFDKVMDAARSYKSCSHLPGSIKELLKEEEAAAKIEWGKILRLKLQPVFTHHNRWSTPKRKLIHQGLYVPGKSKGGVGELVIYIDTSGSMSLEEICQILGEYRHIFEELRPTKMHLVYFHGKVWQHTIVNPFEEVPLLKEIERGGTCIVKPVEYIKQEGIEPVAAVVMSDGEFFRYPDQPTYPVFWCCTENRNIPYGEYIKLEL